MMLGWFRKGAKIERCVILDPLFPWPALHHGREAMRIYAARQNKRRLSLGDEGPMRMLWGLRAAVKETGQAEIFVWPTDAEGHPRHWSTNDVCWQSELNQMADFVGTDLLCDVKLRWMPGGRPFTKTLTVPSLQGIPGFYGWRRGETEPKASVMRRRIRDGLITKAREERAWP